MQRHLAILWYNRGQHSAVRFALRKGATMSAMTVEVADPELQRLLAQVRSVDELILTQNGKPVARLLPVTKKRPSPSRSTSPAVVNAPQFRVSQAGDSMEQEVAAYESQHGALLTQYPGQYIALYQGKVIDHDPDQLNLLARIDQQYPAISVLIRKVERTLPKPRRVRSPRYQKTR